MKENTDIQTEYEAVLRSIGQQLQQFFCAQRHILNTLYMIDQRLRTVVQCKIIYIAISRGCIYYDNGWYLHQYFIWGCKSQGTTSKVCNINGYY